MPTIRRSSRPRIPTQKALEATTVLSARVEKRRSSRIAALNPASKKITSRPKSRPPKLQLALTDFIVNDNPNNSDTDEDEEDSNDSDFDTDCPSSPDSEEFKNLTGDNIEYLAADDLGRRDSYDSRLESGNEEYERDDFVVDDDEKSDSVSDAGSEITITQDIAGGRRHASTSSSSSSSSASSSEANAKHEVEATARKDSLTFHTFSSSGLFVIDDDECYNASPKSPVDVVLKTVDDDVDPADIAEEIVDAVSRFSRRCNRHCEPLRLDLTGEMFGDDEVADAMHLAVKQGVGVYEKVLDGSRVLCTVGPRT